MNLTKLLVIHAVLTFAAGIVLINAPAQIPNTVDIVIDPPAYLVCYLLGSAELSLAFLSYYSRKITDPKSLLIICLTFVFFHMATAAVEVYAYLQGGSPKLWINVAVRLAIAILFLHLGVFKNLNAIKRNYNHTIK